MRAMIAPSSRPPEGQGHVAFPMGCVDFAQCTPSSFSSRQTSVSQPPENMKRISFSSTPQNFVLDTFENWCLDSSNVCMFGKNCNGTGPIEQTACQNVSTCHREITLKKHDSSNGGEPVLDTCSSSGDSFDNKKNTIPLSHDKETRRRTKLAWLRRSQITKSPSRSWYD